MPPLYGPLGVTPEAVRQGELGSCYFHAVIAAIAVHHASLLERAITDRGGGDYTVRLADSTETVHLADVLFARQNRFDLSDGLWVTVLLRALAQNTLRKALLASIASSSLPATARFSATQLVSGSDTVVLAYDRAVRAVLTQDATLDRDTLKASLAAEARALNLPAFATQPVLDFLDAEGFFTTLAAEVKANGELFGAYRSVGNGGLPSRVLLAFGLTPQTRRLSGPDGARELAVRVNSGAAMIASTALTLAPALAAKVSVGQAPAWWAAGHAYTVLGYDPTRNAVNLRNPWGRVPDPTGAFQLSVADFAAGFLEFTYSK